MRYTKIMRGDKFICFLPQLPNTKEEKEVVEDDKLYVSRESFLQKNVKGFLLFCVCVLGYVVKLCHARWAMHVVGRWLAGEKKSMVLAPRDHGKSTILTVAYVIWRIILNPDIRILIVSNSADAAKKFLAAISSHFEKNDVLRKMFGDYVGRRKWNDSEIIVSKRTAVGFKEPTVNTVGVFGTIVSGHYDLVIAEDIVDFENSRTQNQRDKIWSWYLTVVYPTVETDELDPSKQGEQTVRGTRYHYDDFYGRSIGEVESFKPGLFAGSEMIDSALNENETVALWPERKSVKTLKQIQRDVGSVIFALQYQNNAELTKGRIFSPQYFMNFYEALPDPSEIIVVAGYDLAITKNTDSDYFSETIVAGDKKRNIYLIDTMHARLSAPEQYKYIQKSHEKWQWIKGGVENVAYQEALPQFLRDNTGVPVKSVPRTKDKVTRAYKIQPIFENSKFFMPKGRQFPDFVNEMTLFPDATHDDFFDSLETAIDLIYGGKEFTYFFVDEQGEAVAVNPDAMKNKKRLIISETNTEIFLPPGVAEDIILSGGML